MKKNDILEKIKGNEKLIGEILGGFISSSIDVAELEVIPFEDQHKYILRFKFKEKSLQYPALQKGVARDPKPDEMKLQQGRKHSPTRKPLAADHPASSQKGFYWTEKRDKIIKDNFEELGPSGIYDKSLLPGFSLTQIRKHCQDLGLMDQYGNSKVKNGAGPDS